MNMSDSTLRIIAIVLLIVGWIGCCCVFSDPSFAQNAEVKPSESMTKEVKPAEILTKEGEPGVITIEDISNEMTALHLQLREIENSLTDNTLSERIKQSIPLFRKKMLLMKAQFKTVTYDLYGPEEIEELHSVWKDFYNRLSKNKRQLNQEITKLNGWLGEVQQQLELWESTEAAAESKNAPQISMSDIKSTVEYLKSIEQKLIKSRNEILILEGQISEEQQSAKIILEEIVTLKSDMLGAFFKRQDELLWRIGLAPGDFQESLKLFLQSPGVRIKEIEEYGSNHPFRLFFYGLLIIVLLPLTHWSRTTLKKHDALCSDNSDKRISPLDIVAYPLSYALLLGLTLTVLINYLRLEVPFGFLVLMWFPLMLVWLSVFYKVLARELHAPLYGLAVLLVIDMARGTPRDLHLITRLILTVELALSLGGAVWMLRSQYFNKISLFLDGNMWLRVVKGWHLLSIALLSVGLVAAFSGYLILADLLARNVIFGTLLGIVFMASVRIIEAMVRSAVVADILDFVFTIKNKRELFLALVRRILRAFSFFIFIYLILQSIALWSKFQEIVEVILSTQLGYGPISFSLASFLVFGLTLWLSWLLARFVSFALNEEVFTRVTTQPGVPLAISTFTRYAILTFGFIIAMAMIGFSPDRITLAISALGVGIGFGLQNIVNNFVSGIILLSERPVRVGDLVQINDLMGRVKNIGLRTSNIHTLDGADIIVPNGDLASAQVTNWTFSDRKRRIILPVGVAYGTNLRKVLDILLSIARSHPQILDDPAPSAFFRSFGNSSLDFELRAWTGNIDERLSIMSELGVAISDALAEAGIEIPFPQHDLHLKTVTHQLGEVLTETLKTGQQEKPDPKEESKNYMQAGKEYHQKEG